MKNSLHKSDRDVTTFSISQVKLKTLLFSFCFAFLSLHNRLRHSIDLKKSWNSVAGWENHLSSFIVEGTSLFKRQNVFNEKRRIFDQTNKMQVFIKSRQFIFLANCCNFLDSVIAQVKVNSGKKFNCRMSFWGNETNQKSKLKYLIFSKAFSPQWHILTIVNTPQDSHCLSPELSYLEIHFVAIKEIRRLEDSLQHTRCFAITT